VRRCWLELNRFRRPLGQSGVRPPSRTIVALLPLLLLAVTISSCGGDSGPVTAGVLEETTDAYPGDIGQWVIEVEADPDGDLAFNVDEVVSPPGNTNFVFQNPQAVGHDLAVETIGGKQQGKTEIVKEDLGWVRLYLPPDAEYVFYCSVPGHREAGMEGTLTIDEGVEPEGIS
jgi:plastocyanin